MLKILNLETLNKLPDTYGYISLGNIEIQNQGTAADLLINIWFKGEIEDTGLGKSFEVYIVNSGLLAWVVLGNLNCIPGNYVVDPEPLLKELEEKIKKKRESEYSWGNSFSSHNTGFATSITSAQATFKYVGDLATTGPMEKGSLVYDQNTGGLYVSDSNKLDKVTC